MSEYFNTQGIVVSHVHSSQERPVYKCFAIPGFQFCNEK